MHEENCQGFPVLQMSLKISANSQNFYFENLLVQDLGFFTKILYYENLEPVTYTSYHAHHQHQFMWKSSKYRYIICTLIDVY